MALSARPKPDARRSVDSLYRTHRRRQIRRSAVVFAIPSRPPRRWRFHEFLSDAAHAHAPSTISIDPVDNIDNPYSIEGHVSFNDGTDVSAPIVTFLSQKDKANGKLGWWHIEDPSFGTTISLLELDNRLFAFWGVGVVFEASRGLWTVSWDDDRTQELASGASSTKTRTQFGYPNFVQHPKTLQFQRCDFNV